VINSEVTTTLDLIQIASPCPAAWDEMVGDEKVRFCKLCKLNVYNLSEMGREEAEAFVSQREGRTCVRLFRRADGTVLTKDCPVGVRALRQRVVRAAAALAGLIVAMVSGTLFGSIFNRVLPTRFKSPVHALANWVDPQPEFAVGVMGGLCPPPPTLMPMTPVLEPAETPLLPPTPQQLAEIQERLKQ
jgi:hypothetical protein